jgi:hypothetical protein
MNKEKIMSKSRNQREGKFIPGWCLNPNYKKGRDGVYRSGLRAGATADVKGVRNAFDGYAVIPGLTFIRSLRVGV